MVKFDKWRAMGKGLVDKIFNLSEKTVNSAQKIYTDNEKEGHCDIK